MLHAIEQHRSCKHIHISQPSSIRCIVLWAFYGDRYCGRGHCEICIISTTFQTYKEMRKGLFSFRGRPTSLRVKLSGLHTPRVTVPLRDKFQLCYVSVFSSLCFYCSDRPDGMPEVRATYSLILTLYHPLCQRRSSVRHNAGFNTTQSSPGKFWTATTACGAAAGGPGSMIPFKATSPHDVETLKSSQEFTWANSIAGIFSEGTCTMQRLCFSAQGQRTVKGCWTTD